ncbi:MAG: DUF167 domain-containing protein [Patescibacteria group bacterium]
MTRLVVRVVPNAKRSESAERRDGAWIIRLAAPPVEGKANKELLSFLAETLDVTPSAIDIVKGHGSRLKTLDVPMSQPDIEEALKIKPPSP